MLINKCKTLAIGLILSAGMFASTAQASLIINGDGTLGDSKQGITWLQDANVNGLINFSDAESWAEGLDFAGFSDWRLPTIEELTSMYAYSPTPLESFTNVPAPTITPTSSQILVYWSGTVPSSIPMTFDFIDGSQSFGFKNPNHYAMAVRTNNVPVSAPGNALLVVLALAGLTASRRKKAVK